MELRHLLYFKTVAEELHFRNAASKLCISQPPLSRQIRELETALGARLFERNNKRVVLTPAGQYFKQEVDRIFSQLETSKNLVKQISGAVSGQLRIGYISSTYHVHLVEVLKEIRSVYPYVKTKLYEVPTIKQVQALEEGKLDVGILRAPVNSERLTIQSLFHDPFAVVVPAAAPAFDSQDGLVQYLQKQPFIFFNREYAPDYHHKLIESCQRLGFMPSIEHESNNIHSILRLVESGLGVSLVPYSLSTQRVHSDQEQQVRQWPGLKFYEIGREAITTEVVLAYKSTALEAPTAWFVERYCKFFK